VDCASHISIGLILGLLEETLSAYTLMKLLRSYLCFLIFYSIPVPKLVRSYSTHEIQSCQVDLQEKVPCNVHLEIIDRKRSGITD
jgi:hypothetical protein